MCGQNKVLKCLQVEEEQKEVNMGEMKNEVNRQKN